MFYSESLNKNNVFIWTDVQDSLFLFLSEI